MMLYRCLLYLALLFDAVAAHAFSVDDPVAIDSRIKTYIYSPTEVFPVTVHYGYSMHIDLRSGEVVNDIILGDNAEWSIVIKGNRIFIRANESGAHTNMTVITNKDVYEFDLYSRSSDDGIDMDMAYVVRFFYPPTDEDMSALMGSGAVIAHGGRSMDTGDLLSGDMQYFSRFDGDKALAPVAVFTDGKLTYFKFHDNMTVPLIYEAVTGKEEKLLDILQYNKYVIVDSASSRFVLKKQRLKMVVERGR